MYGFYFSQSWLIFVGVPLVIAMWAQFRVTSAFSKYSRIRASSNLTGADTAREILAAAQIHDVEVVRVDGFLGDHYDPTGKRLCLSGATYDTPSLAAVGIAAHECGHAIQHAKGYAPLEARMIVVPVTQIASNILPFIFIGAFVVPFLGFMLIKLAVVCYLILTLFQLVTLPVEFDASRRAKIILQQMGIVQPGEEAAGVNRMLNAAALTYVAAFIASLGNLLWLLSLGQRRN
jgi:Zn-dependent membrane protease YugP